jgi:hypothetical protein
MTWCRLIRDRRIGDRPSNGDRKVCPKCRSHSAEFNERYRLPNAHGRTPAWVCDASGCGYSEAVRVDDKRRLMSGRRRMASMRLRAGQRKSGG